MSSRDRLARALALIDAIAGAEIEISEAQIEHLEVMIAADINAELDALMKEVDDSQIATDSAVKYG